MYKTFWPFLIHLLSIQAQSMVNNRACNDLQWTDFLNPDDVGCFAKTTEYEDTVSSISSRHVTAIKCLNITKQVECIKKASNICHDEESKSKILLNFMENQFEEAFDEDRLFGQALLVSCPIMRQFERNVIKKLSGAATCNYSEVHKEFSGFKSCEKKAIADKDTKLKMLAFAIDRISYFTNTWCDMRTDFIKCRNVLGKCASDQVLSKIRQDQENGFDFIQSRLRKNSLPSFNFHSSCQKVTSLGIFKISSEFASIPL